MPLSRSSSAPKLRSLGNGDASVSGGGGGLGGSQRSLRSLQTNLGSRPRFGRSGTRTKKQKATPPRTPSMMDDIELELFKLQEKEKQRQQQQQQQQQQEQEQEETNSDSTTTTSGSSSPSFGGGGGGRVSIKERVSRSLSPKMNSSRRRMMPSRPGLSRQTFSHKNLFANNMGNDDSSDDSCGGPPSSSGGPAFGRSLTYMKDDESDDGTSSDDNDKMNGRRRGSIRMMARRGGRRPATTIARERLDKIFGEPSWLMEGSAFTWETYFQDNSTASSSNSKGMDDDLEMAIRTKDLDQLKHLWNCGVSMDSRSNLGESVAHLVCRESCLEQLQFLISEAKVNLRVRDHAHKTVLHEIAWSPYFEPELVLAVINVAPELLWATDQRQFLPMDYVPKQAQNEWYSFLKSKKSAIEQAMIISRCRENMHQFNASMERLQRIIEVHNTSKRRVMEAVTTTTTAAAAATTKTAAAVV